MCIRDRPKFAQPVETPALGTYPILAQPMLGQLSLVSATHTAPTVPLNLRTVPQARSSVVSSSVMASGAAVSTAVCTAPSHVVPVANIQLPVKPQAGTLPTPIATQTSLVSAVPPVATSVSAPPVMTTVQAATSSVSTSIAPVATVTAAPAAPIVIVKQPKPTVKLLGSPIRNTLPVWPYVMGGRPGLRKLRICS